MKDIRVFVASSKELIAERNALAYLVLSKEEDFAARGFRVRLSKWEYVDPTMTEARTEDRYLDEMYNCDAVLMLFRHVLGKYTKEEVDKAIAAETAGTSRIKKHLILFKEGDADASPELAAWRASLAEGAYGTFTDAAGLGEHFLRLVEEIAGLPLQDATDTETERTISAFLAVDDELAVDRDAFADAVLNLNDVLSRRGVRVRLRFYDPVRHRDMLDSSEMALVLYQTKCGKFGGAELKEAYDRSKREQNPRRLYVFFRDASGRPLDDAFQALKDGFAETFGSAPCRFENVDTLSLNFLFALESMLGDGAGTFVKLDGRTVVADGLDVGDLTKLPMLAKNEGLAELFSRMADVGKRFVAQREKCDRNPQDDGLYVELLDLSSEKNRLQDQIDRELKMSFNLAKRLAAISMAQVTEAIARARAKVEEGRIKEALEILDGASAAMKRRRLLHRAADRAEAEELQIKELKASAEIEYFRVDAIMAYTAMPFEERFKKVEDIYKSLVDDIEKFSLLCTMGHRLEVDLFLADAVKRFARHYAGAGRNEHEAMELFARALKLYQSSSDEYEHIVAIKTEMAEVCVREEFYDLAESILLDAKEECDTALKAKPMAYFIRCARIARSLSKVYLKTGKGEAAINTSGHAVRLAEKLYLFQPDGFGKGYVEALRMHGFSHHYNKDYETALKIFEKALEISRKIGLRQGIGAISNALGDVYREIGDFGKAKVAYLGALTECRDLWLENPLRYEELAYSLADGVGRIVAREDLSDEVCATFGGLLKNASVGFAKKIIQRMNLIGYHYQLSGALSDAIKVYEFSFSKSCELVKNSSKEHELEVAASLRHLMDIYYRTADFESAATTGLKALEIRQKWDSGSLWIVTTLERLAKIHQARGALNQSIEMRDQADEMRRSLSVGTNGMRVRPSKK